VKVIFLEDVSGIARAGQTRTVADGYARNYLLPRRLAVVADSKASTQLEAQLRRITKRQALEEIELKELAEKLTGTRVTVKAKVGESDKLYGSVTAATIAAALEGPAGREIDKRKIEIAEPIRHLGTHEVTIRFLHDISAAIEVVVEAEETAAKPEKDEKKAEAKAAEETTAAAPEEAVAEAPVEESAAETVGAETAEAPAAEKPAKKTKTKAKAAKKTKKAAAKADKETEAKPDKEA